MKSNKTLGEPNLGGRWENEHLGNEPWGTKKKKKKIKTLGEPLGQNLGETLEKLWGDKVLEKPLGKSFRRNPFFLFIYLFLLSFLSIMLLLTTPGFTISIPPDEIISKRNIRLTCKSL